MTARTGKVRFVLLAALGIVVLALVPAAFAARGGGHSGGGGTTSGSGSMTLVLLNSSDSVANWGESVTFTVSTTATTRPFVALQCSQGGVQVYSMSAGFFPDYPFTTTYVLKSSSWTGGAASCTATLYYVNSKGGDTIIGTMSVPVSA